MPISPRLLALKAHLKAEPLAELVQATRARRLRPHKTLSRKQLAQMRTVAMGMSLEELEGVLAKMEPGEPT